MTDYNKPVRIKQGKSFNEYPDHHLYERKPKSKETFPDAKGKGKKSWASSIESYERMARKHFYALVQNGRKPNYEIVINITQNYFIPDITKFRKTLQSIFQHFRRKKQIVAVFMLEITKGEHKRNPIDQVHLHCTIDSRLTMTQLIEHIRNAMKAAKVRYAITKQDRITSKNRNSIYRYIVKYNCWEKDENGERKRKILPILFKEGLRIQKVYEVGNFWIDQEGNPTNVDELWEPIAKAWRQRETANPIPFTLKELGIRPAKRKPAAAKPCVKRNHPIIQPSIPPVVEPPNKNKESLPFAISCTHFEDGDYEYCGHYHDCGQYPECRLIPSID